MAHSFAVAPVIIPKTRAIKVRFEKASVFDQTDTMQNVLVIHRIAALFFRY